MTIASALAKIRARISESALAAGRRPDDITLIAVSKLQPIELVFEAFDLGVREFGENTVQGLEQKAEAFAKSGRAARWHLIGRLQRNKAKEALKHAVMIQSVDREELADALSRRAGPDGIDALVQVNVGREEQKGGVDPDLAVAFARTVAGKPGLRLRGLMGIPPLDADPVPYFQLLAQLSKKLRATPEGATASVVSMGMSHDFDLAIQYGSTMVRVGTALFGER